MINPNRAPPARIEPEPHSHKVIKPRRERVLYNTLLVQSLTMTKLCPSLPRHDDREEKAERRAKGRAPSQRHEACC